MWQKVHQEDLHHSERDILIPIALALKQRNILMKIQGDHIIDVTSEGIPEQEVIFDTIQPIYGPLSKPTGIFKITASFPGHPHMAFMEGTLEEIARTFRFLPPCHLE